MPKRTGLQSILVLGSGPIVIGQAAEFDYSGTQAVRALREEGYRVILVNNGLATIMTDTDMASATYIQPITLSAAQRTYYLRLITRRTRRKRENAENAFLRVLILVVRGEMSRDMFLAAGTYRTVRR